MRVDIYRRPEAAGQFSYLVVPEGKIIPEEATNLEWETAERGIDLASNADALANFAIDDPFEQIDSKGYAITSVKHLGNGHL